MHGYSIAADGVTDQHAYSMTLEPPLVSPPYKDKKTGLIVFGVFQILLGAFFVLALLAMVAGQYAIAHHPELAGRTDPRSLLSTIALMGAFAVACLWLGIGAIKARRWARSINLCVGAMGLVFGVFACGALIWTLPSMDAMLRQNGQTGQHLPAAALVIVKIITVVTTLFFYVVIPGALFLFYRSEHVRLTCEARDPVVRWTDRCPSPVLAIVLLQAFGVASMLLFIPVYGRAFPFFGLLLQGGSATAVYALFGLLMLALTWGFYRLRLRAFWTYFGVIVLFTISGLVTFSGDGLMSYYRAIGLPEAQIRQIDQMPIMHSSAFLWFGVVGALLFLGYLLWLKKYFIGRSSDGGQAVRSTLSKR